MPLFLIGFADIEFYPPAFSFCGITLPSSLRDATSPDRGGNPFSEEVIASLRFSFADRCFYAKEYFFVIKRKSAILCGFLRFFEKFAKEFLYILCIFYFYLQKILHIRFFILLGFYIFVQVA